MWKPQALIWLHPGLRLLRLVRALRMVSHFKVRGKATAPSYSIQFCLVWRKPTICFCCLLFVPSSFCGVLAACCCRSCCCSGVVHMLNLGWSREQVDLSRPCCYFLQTKRTLQMLVPIWKTGSTMIHHTSVPIPTCCFMLQVMWRLVYSLLTAGQTMLSTTVLILFRARNNGHSMLFFM